MKDKNLKWHALILIENKCDTGLPNVIANYGNSEKTLKIEQNFSCKLHLNVKQMYKQNLKYFQVKKLKNQTFKSDG